MRRSVLINKFNNYTNEDPQTRKHLGDLLFQLYYHRNDSEIELTLEEIRWDIQRLEVAERYERCQMLKDILDRFE